MKFLSSIVSFLALSGAAAVPKPKPKPKPTPVLANTTAQYSTTSGAQGSAGTLSALSMDLFGDEASYHISFSMKSRSSVISLPDSLSVGLYSFGGKSADWAARGLISGRYDKSLLSMGEGVSTSGSMVAMTAVKSYRTYLNESCLNCDIDDTPSCCGDFQNSTDVMLQTYRVPSSAKQGVQLSQELSLLSTLALYDVYPENDELASVSVDASSEGMLIAGLSWMSDSQVALGVLIFTAVENTNTPSYSSQFVSVPMDSDDDASASEPPAIAVAVAAEGQDLAMGVAGAVFVCRLVEGAQSEDSSSSASQDMASTSSWQLTQTLQAVPTDDYDGSTFSHFGAAVSTSDDVLAVGAFGVDVDDDGCVFVYSRAVDSNSSDWQWVLQTILWPSDSFAGNLFGFSVSVAGGTVLVGAPLATNDAGIATGAAYTFSRFTNASTSISYWMETAKFFDGVNTSGVCFGSNVAATSEGLLLFGAAPVQVMERLDYGSASQYLAESAARVFTFIPTNLKNSQSSSGKDQSTRPQYLKPLIIAVGILLGSVPVALIVFVVYRRQREAENSSQPLADQDESGGAPVLRISPLQDTCAIGGGDVESSHRGNDGESPAGTPQGLGARQKNSRNGLYKEIGVSEHYGSSIWSSLKRVFAPPVDSVTPQASPMQQPSSVSEKRNPMTVPPVATV